MRRLVVFLDDGGVMNDNRSRASQWQPLVAEALAPVLGGRYEAWIKANRVVMERMFDPEAWESRIQAATTYAEFDRAYLLDWLGDMCELVGVPMPPDKEALDIASRVNASIPRRIRSAFPGAVDAIRELHGRGYQLHTASGESSADLAGYLTGMGVLDCFGRLYGPDLVDTLKGRPDYYPRVFSDAGVSPADAVVVDDNASVLMSAAQIGARTVLVGRAPGAEVMLQIDRLADLPEVIEELG